MTILETFGKDKWTHENGQVPFLTEWDGWIYSDVVLGNYYRFADDMSGELVLDIGAHIGFASIFAASLGADKVYAYEAHPSNYKRLLENTKSFGERIEAHNFAVWKSGVPSEYVYVGDHKDDCNMGGVTVHERDIGNPVKTIGLDEILTKIQSECGRYPTIIKMDCEGSEFPILLSSSLFHNSRSIVGEVHPNPAISLFCQVGYFGYATETLVRHLREHGYEVEHSLGETALFHATKDIK
jgi:FkbM family methyltransferase